MALSVAPLVRRAPDVALLRWVRSSPAATVLTQAGLIVLALLLTRAIYMWPETIPWGVYLPLIIAAGLLLEPPRLLVVGLVVLACYAVLMLSDQLRHRAGLWVAIVVSLVTLVMMFSVSRSRARLGVAGNVGDSMLVDLRDRLRAQGEIPQLPPNFHIETCVRSAYGQGFSGDFIVATRSTDGDKVEIALVDVSGKGTRAGTRSLLLSGAFGGLIGALPEQKFLAAANNYLLRQRWIEGFATAVHLALDVETGAYSIGHAGHPASAAFDSTTGRWRLLDESAGALLGVIEDLHYTRQEGILAPGGALLLYSDGMIEGRAQPLQIGLDRMLGTATTLTQSGFAGGGAVLADHAVSGVGDDRAVVLIWRD